jgi:hypothetical protein
MFITNISRKAFVQPRLTLLSFFCLVLLILLSSCTNGTGADATVAATTTSIGGDTSYIPVSANPEITVKSENVVQLTLTGTDTQSISTAQLALPYTKDGNKITIDFGQTVVQPLEIKIPRAANLNLTVANGNVIIDTIQGQIVTTLNSGTIKIKNFTPSGTNNIQTKNGTIDVAFGDTTSCNVQAQTNFGAIVSSYATISQKRNAMKATASGTIGNSSGTTVNLTVGYGSITVGRA